MRDKLLETKIFNYIRSNESDRIDNVDITTHFSRYNISKVIDALTYLRKEQRIFRVGAGIHYYYTTFKPEEL